MKSGTTYLQRLQASGILESVGGFYAGGSFGAQTRAVASLLRQTERRRPKAWQDLAGRVLRRDGTAFYSHEFLSFASRDRARQVVESFDGAPVEVLLTVRDQRLVIPAQWQSFVRNRGVERWDAYVRRLDSLRVAEGGRAGRGKAVRSYRRAQDVPAILARWLGHRGVSTVGVVLVPAAGSPPEALWQRFCEGAGIAAPEPQHAETRLNESLGYASCDLLRRLNVPLAGLTRKEHERARKAPVRALLPLRAEEQRPVLDRSGAALARELNRRILHVASRDDVRLFGAPDDLPTEDEESEPSSIPPPDPDELCRALDAVWSTCVPGLAAPAGELDDVVRELGRRLAARFGP